MSGRARLVYALGILIAVVVLSSSTASAELLWPLDYPPRVSSTFGTYRISHHHAGIDITTDGDTSVAVVAVADGEIYRVRRNDVGFGRAVYIQHADDQQTVYAHLAAFAPLLTETVRAAEARKGTFKLDIRLRDRIPVKRGQVLGWIGTSGTDLLHLHFELRDHGQPVNPLTRGLPLPDTQAPAFRRLMAIPRTAKSHVEGGLDERFFRFGPDGTLDGPVRLGGDVQLLIEAVDFIDGLSRPLTPYRVELYIDDRLWHRSVYDTVSYLERGHTELDFHPRLRATGEGMFHKLVADEGPRVRAHRKPGRSIAGLKRGRHAARIVARDAAGNESVARFEIEVVKPEPPCEPPRRRVSGRSKAERVDSPLLRGTVLAIPAPELCEADRYDVRIDNRRARAVLTRWKGAPALAFTVEPEEGARIELGLKVGERTRWGRVDVIAGPPGEAQAAGPVQVEVGEESRFVPYPTVLDRVDPPTTGPGLEPVTAQYTLGNGWQPTKGGSRIGLRMPPAMPDGSAVYLNDRGRWWWLGRGRKSGYLRGYAVHLGTFAIMTDTEPPAIGAARVEGQVFGPQLVVPMDDRGSGIRRWSLTIDGEPVLAERQRAWRRVVYRPLNPLAPGAHRYEVTLTDRAGHTVTESGSFVWPEAARSPASGAP